jgi:hypothetical protein
MSPLLEMLDSLKPAYGRRERRRAGRIRQVAVVSGGIAACVLAGFAFFVAVSWGALTDAAGLAGLLGLLTLVVLTAVVWSKVVVRKIFDPLVPLARGLRVTTAAVSAVALLCGVFAVPWTRDQLEGDKCRKVAEADAQAQEACRDWLEGRRQWWALGLSHRNGNG